MIFEILSKAIEQKASDVILATGNIPALKLYGKIVYLNEYETLDSSLKGDIELLMSEEQKKHFVSHGEIDFSYEKEEIGRFRVNIFSQSKGLTVVLRVVGTSIPTLENIALPENIASLLERKSGLILVTGGVGSGKSTSLAAMINHINEHTSRHIICIEDPIEYIHSSKKSLIEQREVGKNTQSYENGLMYALRESSDVIMIGEMRDLETFRLALRAAETGNLVLTTLHTSGAARTIARIIDMFPGDEKNHIRTQLAESLLAVLWQDLIPSSQEGRVLAYELLIKNTGIENMIRENHIHQINGAIETGKQDGMVPMKLSLKKLLESGAISEEVYERYTTMYGMS